MEIQYLGHSCFMLSDETHKLLLDPFISGNPLAESIDISSLKPDFIFLSHGHQDHVLDVEAIYSQSEAQIVSNFEVASWFQNKGMERVNPMNHGGILTTGFGHVKLVNAIHSSSMPDGSYGGNRWVL